MFILMEADILNRAFIVQGTVQWPFSTWSFKILIWIVEVIPAQVHDEFEHTDHWDKEANNLVWYTHLTGEWRRGIKQSIWSTASLIRMPYLYLFHVFHISGSVFEFNKDEHTCTLSSSLASPHDHCWSTNRSPLTRNDHCQLINNRWWSSMSSKIDHH